MGGRISHPEHKIMWFLLLLFCFLGGWGVGGIASAAQNIVILPRCVVTVRSSLLSQQLPVWLNKRGGSRGINSPLLAVGNVGVESLLRTVPPFALSPLSASFAMTR